MTVQSQNFKQEVLMHYNAQKSFWYFLTQVLGYREDSEIGYYDLTRTHQELANILQYEKKKSKLILMPRESIKSQIITIGYALWRLVRNPNLRILIYSDNNRKAEGFLFGIKSHIEGKAANSRFRELYPNWETDAHSGGVYNQSRITIRPREHDQKEPTIDTAGIESSLIGMHYDLILFDDIVSDINTTTKVQMDKVFDCYKKSLSLLKRGGETVLVGTRWHYGDCYGRLISENKETDEFYEFIRDCEELVDGKLIFHDIGMTRDWLDKQRIKQGSYFYSCLYRNNPVSDETAIFKQDNFKYYHPHENFHKNMFITATCDPAGEGEDFTAITVVGTDNDKNMHVLDAVNDHLKPNQIIDQIIRLNYKWSFNRFAIEKNFFKGMLEKQLRDAIAQESANSMFKSFSVEEVIASARQRTFSRVLSLQPYQERGAIRLPGTDFNRLSRVYGELAMQMLQFTIDGSKSPHNDLLISLAMHPDIIAKGGGALKADPPKSSAVALENDFFNRLNSRNSRIPMRYRRVYQRSFS